jgi:hypothetical protein
MSGMAGGFGSQADAARSKKQNNLGSGHGGAYRSAQEAYYIDEGTKRKQQKAEAAKRLFAQQQRKKEAAKAAALVPPASEDETLEQKHSRGAKEAAAREARLEAEQKEIDARRRRKVVETASNGVAISAAENMKEYELKPQREVMKVIKVGGSFADPKGHVTEAINLAKDGYVVRIEVTPAARIKFASFLQNAVKRLKLSKEHAERIIIADATVKQSDKFNPDQVAVGDVSQDVRDSAKGASADPLRGLE